MINEIVVQIIANRIISKGLNPKTGQEFKLEDIKDLGYKTAIENYIIEHSGAIQ